MKEDMIPRVSTLYAAFAATAPVPAPIGGKLRFTGVDGQDVYNITPPFRTAGRTVVAGRVEARDSEQSAAIFFEERHGTWQPVEGAPRFAFQDPFVARIAGELVFGGVEVWEGEDGLFAWRTVFYRGGDIFDLRPFFAGPVGMKDIRLCELADGRVAVFTRPRGAKGGRGTIGYVEVPNLDALTVEAIDAAPMLEGMFHPLDWGGVNEAHLLETGEIGLIAHAAFFKDDILYGERRYFATAFTFDPATRTWRDHRVIAAREQFAPGAAKRPDLVDVVFSSGIVGVGSATRLYAGTSDAEAQWVELPYPFDAGRAAAPDHERTADRLLVADEFPTGLTQTQTPPNPSVGMTGASQAI